MLLHKHSIGYYLREIDEVLKSLEYDDWSKVFDSNFARHVLPDLEKHRLNILEHIHDDNDVLLHVEDMLSQISEKKFAGKPADDIERSTIVKMQHDLQQLRSYFSDDGRLERTIRLLTQDLRRNDHTSNAQLKKYLRDLQETLHLIRDISRSAAKHIWENKHFIEERLQFLQKEESTLSDFNKNLKSWFDEFETEANQT